MSKSNGIGRRLAEARERKGLTQAELANRLSSDARTYQSQRVSNIECGRAQPDVAEIAELADVLGIRPEWLAYGVGARAQRAEIK